MNIGLLVFSASQLRQELNHSMCLEQQVEEAQAASRERDGVPEAQSEVKKKAE